MPAVHIKAYGVDRPACRWKQATRTYILTENPDEVTCRKCMGTLRYHSQGETVKLQKKASLHEKTVQKVAKENISKASRGRGKGKRPNTSKVTIRHWSDGVHPMIVKYVQQNKIHHSRIEVRGPEEIVVR